MPRKTHGLHLWRRISQTFFLLALNPYFFMYRGFCFPAMNCWACPAAAFGCPVGAIGNLLVRGLVPFATVGLLLVAGVLIGRMICGWVCPFGFLQDLMAKLTKRKIAMPKALSYLKYAILVGMVIWVPLQFGQEGLQTPAFFCTYCPAGTLEAAIPVKLGWSRFDGAAAGGEAAAAAPADGGAGAGAAADEEPASPPSGGGDAFGDPDLFGDEPVAPAAAGPGAPPPAASDWLAGARAAQAESTLSFFLLHPRMWVLYVFLALFILMQRPFCKAICPIGASFALFNRFSLFRVRVRKDACKSCNLCTKACPVGNKVYCTPSSDDCVRCLECVDSCVRGGVKAGLISVLPREEYWE